MISPSAKFTEILHERKFILSAEIIAPAQDADLAPGLSQLEELKKSGVEMFAVTKHAIGGRRTHNLLTARAIFERFKMPCIAHLIARDLLPEEIEKDLVQYEKFGVKNILALRGDPPEGVLEWQPRPGSYFYAYQLVEQIRAKKHDFCVGVACYPDLPEKENGSIFLPVRKKQEPSSRSRR